MRKVIFSFLLCCACMSIAQTNDRLDVLTKEGNTKSVMVDNVECIKYLRSNASESLGYNQVLITLKNGNQVIWDLNDYNEIFYKTPSDKWLEIARKNDDHSWIIMYDCINNEGVMDPNKPYDWTAERCGEMPHFNYFAEKGFDSYYTLRGMYTGTIYSDIEGFVWWSLPEDNHIGISSWTFIMPNEPVTIAATSVERTTYNNAAFIGEYRGFPIKIGYNRLYKGKEAEAMFSINIKGNESCIIKSTDENAYNFDEWYIYNKDKNTIAYNEKTFEGVKGKGDIVYAASGSFFDENNIFIDIYNLTEDKPENMRYYFASKDMKNYVCAAKDDYGFEYLVENTDSKNLKTWYFISNYGNKKTEAFLDFKYGKSIGEMCEGFISYDGEIQMKYSLGYDSAPLFIAKGKEAGFYKSLGDDSSNLILDGFGSAEYNGKSYDYEYDGLFVKIYIYGEISLFEIDKETMKFNEVKSDEWNGPMDFINENIYGGYSLENTNADNMATLFIDRSVTDEERKGYAKFVVDLKDNNAYNNILKDCKRYIWRADKHELILTDVLVGVETGGLVKKHLIFTVSEDMNSIYIKGDEYQTRIFSTQSIGAFVNINKENALVAPQKKELSSEYKGIFKVLNFGEECGEAECILKIDKDTDGGKKVGYASIAATFMNAYLMNTSAKYSVKNNILTLHNVIVGDGNYGTQVVDIVFFINEDGSLVGNTAYYGIEMVTALMQIDYSKGMFEPVVQKTYVYIPDENFKTYLVQNFDKNADGEISYEEAEAITSIKCSSSNIYSVEGIEAMLNLQDLSLHGGTFGGKLESIDLSANKKLMWLTLTNNKITKLDLSNNLELDGVWSGDNPISELIISENRKLTTLKLYNTMIKTLDITNMVQLEKLECQESLLEEINVMNNTQLNTLDCSFCHLSGSIDISNNTKLSQLYLNGNPNLETIWVWEGFNESDYEWLFYKDDTAKYKVK